MVDLRGRDFLKLLDYTPEEIRHLIDVAIDLKNLKKNNITHRYLEGKQIAMIFEKDSTTSFVSSVEPSSTISHSKSSKDCLVRESKIRLKLAERLYVGVNTHI